MVRRKIWRSKSLGSGNTPLRIKNQCLPQEVDGCHVNMQTYEPGYSSLPFGSAFRKMSESGLPSRFGSEPMYLSVCHATTGQQERLRNLLSIAHFLGTHGWCRTHAFTILTFWAVILAMTFSDGVPRTSVVTRNWSIWSRPGKSGFPCSISAKMHPVLQISTCSSYLWHVSMVSGAL